LFVSGPPPPPPPIIRAKVLACRLRKTKRASEDDRISLDSPELLVSANLVVF